MTTVTIGAGEAAGSALPRRLAWAALIAGFLGALLLLHLGLQKEKPALLPALALAAPAGAALLFLDAFTLLGLGLVLLPWAIFVNVTDTLPVISFYCFSGLAAVKTLARGGRQEVSPAFLAFAGYGLFLAASAFLLGSLGETKSKLFHWFNFALFFYALYNNADTLDKARRLLTFLVAAACANAVFSIGIYYVANFVFPTAPVFVESVLFRVGKVAYGARGFDLILNGTNWFTESGDLKALGLFHNPTQTSLYALTGFALSAFLLLDRRPLVRKGLLIANLVACLAHLILSSGRSGMAVMPIVMLVWLFALAKVTGFRMAARNVVLVVAILGLIGVGLGNVLLMNFQSLVSLDYYSNAGRLIAMTSGLTVASHAGPLGFGFGNNPTVMQMGHATTFVQEQIGNLIGAVSYSFKAAIAEEYYRQTNYHSLFMELLVQTGYVGFALFLAMFLKLGLPRAGAYPALRYACFASVAAFTLAQGVGGDIFYPKVMIPLLAIAALAERMNARGFPAA